MPFNWGDEHELAFEEIKTRLTTPPVLISFDPKRICRLLTYASVIKLGSILSQMDDNNEEHIIGYYSKKLSETESRYSELECF